VTEQKFLQDLEKKLWTSANKLLPSLDAAVYKHVVLGMVFVKYVSDSFETRRQELRLAFSDPEHDYFLGDDADDEFINEQLENRDFYTEKNIFWIPQAARWAYLQDNARLSMGSPLPLGGEFKGAGKLLDDTMDLIEKENPKLKRILNKDYARLQIEQTKLADLLDLIATIPFAHDTLKSKDILGHVYEYFLGQFAAAEGKKGGQFYTPKSIVNLIVEMVEPYKGRVYDPAMGSGGFFISSEKFIEEHSGRIGDISVYGQESNPTTWRLAAMNMAIRGIDFDFGKEPADTFTKDQHPDLRADFVLANPPFNQDEWWDASLEGDARWKGFTTPPKGNGNYAWMLHMLHHTSPNGVVGLVLSNGSLTSSTSGEGAIREELIKADLVEAIVSLPSQLFANTQIPACIWILNRNKPQKGKTLFIDTKHIGSMLSNSQKSFSDDDIKIIADTFHAFRSGSEYKDIDGKYYSARTEEIIKKEYMLTPAQYIGIAGIEEDGATLGMNLSIYNHYFKESTIIQVELNKQISDHLSEVFPYFKWEEINFSSIDILEDIAYSIFKSWFVDFDPVHVKAAATSDAELEKAAAELGVSKEVLELFPSEFEESEMGLIPKGWKNDSLASFVEILDSKRIPMSKNERSKKQGSIPYYGATSIMDYVDDFIFDEPLTLLGEDGSVVRDDGTPFMQYIWGKAWVNNHAHVIKSKSALSTEAIYVALLKQNVTMFVTGAVQPKINQTNLKKIPTINPGDKLHSVYSELIAPMFAKIRQLSDETETLTKTRDSLLPKLLSGELDVSKDRGK